MKLIRTDLSPEQMARREGWQSGGYVTAAVTMPSRRVFRSLKHDANNLITAMMANLLNELRKKCDSETVYYSITTDPNTPDYPGEYLLLRVWAEQEPTAEACRKELADTMLAMLDAMMATEEARP